MDGLVFVSGLSYCFSVTVMLCPYTELQVNVCRFCQSWESSSSANLPPSVLYVLNPDEKPLCAADALLLFCIDISGSMSITSQVKKTNTHTHTKDTDLFSLADVHMYNCFNRLISGILRCQRESILSTDPVFR